MTNRLLMRRIQLLMLAALLIVSAGCEPGPEHEPEASTPEVSNTAADEFASSFRMRNSEIRADMIAELTKRNIPHKLNEDGSIGYRAMDGEAIDAVYYWAVGLYAARN